MLNTDRTSLIGVGVLPCVGLLATAVPSLLPGMVDWHGVLELLLWATTALVWVVLTYVVGAGYEPPEPAYGGDEIQVRILTIDAEEVVQATVDSLPAEFDDVREFTLYLDEDSHLEPFEGLPGSDVVQLREQPRHTGSVLSYLDTSTAWAPEIARCPTCRSSDGSTVSTAGVRPTRKTLPNVPIRIRTLADPEATPTATRQAN